MIRILLVDDQTFIREALKVLLEQEQDLQIVGSADNGQTAIEQVERLKPDILLIDIQMPEMDGVTATQIICQRFPETKVIVLSGHDDESYLANALRAGAKGYLLKNTASQDLSNTIRSVYRGHGQLGPGLFEKLVARVAPNDGSATEATSSELNRLGLTEPEFLLLLDSFNPELLQEIAKRTIERGVVVELLNRLNQHLRNQPTNLSALYLAGLLASKGQSNLPLAMQYLRFGFKEGLRQKLSQQSLLLLYQEGVRLKPEEAFSWLSQLESRWDSDDVMVFLLQEASRLFGTDSTQYQALLYIRQFRLMERLSKAHIGLGSRVETVLQGFERLNQVLPIVK